MSDTHYDKSLGRVLIVDDEESIRNLLKDSLVRRGYDVTATAEPDVAEKEIELWGAQVVLCDICLTHSDGMQLATKLKEINSGTKVIMITGYPDPSSLEEAAESGADGYLLKPFKSIDEVVEAIHNAEKDIWDWKSTMRDLIKHEFPEEYDIIYSGGDEVPCEEELAAMLAEATSDKVAE